MDLAATLMDSVAAAQAVPFPLDDVPVEPRRDAQVVHQLLQVVVLEQRRARQAVALDRRARLLEDVRDAERAHRARELLRRPLLERDLERDLNFTISFVSRS